MKCDVRQINLQLRFYSVHVCGIIEKMNSLREFELIINCKHFQSNWMIDIEILNADS